MQYALEIWRVYEKCKSVIMNKERRHFEMLMGMGIILKLILKIQQTQHNLSDLQNLH